MPPAPRPLHAFPATWIVYSRGQGLCSITVSASGVSEEEGPWESSYSYWTDGFGVWWGSVGTSGVPASGPAHLYPYMPEDELLTALKTTYHPQEILRKPWSRK